jgi:hypothetical protein
VTERTPHADMHGEDGSGNDTGGWGWGDSEPSNEDLYQWLKGKSCPLRLVGGWDLVPGLSHMSGKKQFFEGPIVFILFSAWDAVVRPHVFRGQ